jgi:hypothetical protein
MRMDWKHAQAWSQEQDAMAWLYAICSQRTRLMLSHAGKLTSQD